MLKLAKIMLLQCLWSLTIRFDTTGIFFLQGKNYNEQKVKCIKFLRKNQMKSLGTVIRHSCIERITQLMTK